jgi:hypothetical protein
MFIGYIYVNKVIQNYNELIIKCTIGVYLYSGGVIWGSKNVDRNSL